MPFPGFRCLFKQRFRKSLNPEAVEGGKLKVRRFPITLALALPLLTVASSDAQQAKPLLQLQTSTSQSVFHIGERIPLTLMFSAADTNRYEITSSSSNRQGCMDYEDFEVTPSKGWADPLAIYYGGGCAGSFLSGLGVLSSKPTIVQHDLNEWIRFDQPGVYKLTVISHRVDEPASASEAGNHLSLKSNSIELHIIPATPEWQRTRLNTILQQLHAIPAGPGMPPPGRTEAVADLRYLATEGAIQELAAGLRDDMPDMMDQAAFGLIGAPDSMRATASDAMERQIDAPAFPVCSFFLHILLFFQATPDTSAPALQEERERLGSAAWQEVYSGLPRKVGPARAVTVQTLLNNKPRSLTPEQALQLSSVLASSFLNLSQEQQANELKYNWDLLRSDTTLAALQVLARLPLKNPGSNLSTVYTTRELKSAALQRWYELDPEGARREIMNQIGSASPSLTAAAISFLPKQSFPEFESIWAEALLSTNNVEQEAVLASLLAHFGSGTATAMVASKLDAKVGEWACTPQAAALGYVVEFDPESALVFIKRAIDARGPAMTGCNHSLFQDVAAYTRSPVLSEAALQTLDDPDHQVIMDALIYLASYGTSEAKQPIWERYLKWSETWAGKGEVLEQRKAGDMAGNWQEVGLGENLARTLIGGQGWLADPALISAVLQRCVGEQICTQLQQFAATAGPPYNVTLYKSGENQNHQIAQYTEKSIDLLEEKLGQYPKGTKFTLISGSPATADQKSLEQEAATVFAKHGMKLESTP
jgi:hypothetical protein